METLPLNQIAKIANGKAFNTPADTSISNFSIDSRNMGRNSIFFALPGEQTDGHHYVEKAIGNGGIAAVVAKNWTIDNPHLKNQIPLIEVESPFTALQKLATWWRQQHQGKWIGITGSNGKTIVKDALIQVLSTRNLTNGSPGSYNTELGVPLSILKVSKKAQFSVIEVGVNEQGEMERIQPVLMPQFGILTNIGMAHISMFGSKESIFKEKIKLFQNITAKGWVLAPGDLPCLDILKNSITCPVHFFGTPSDTLPYIEEKKTYTDGAHLKIKFPRGDRYDVSILNPSLEIITNIDITICAAYLLGIPNESIVQALTNYQPSQTRMEMWRSPTGITILNDSCSSDPIAVKAALNTLTSISQPGQRKIFVFGGMKELGDLEETEHFEIGELAAENNIEILALVGGKELSATEAGYIKHQPHQKIIRSTDTQTLSAILKPIIRSGDNILVKGPRHAKIDRVAQEIYEVIAPNRLIVDLKAVSENISHFRRLTGFKSKILGMVKALAYGSDLIRIAKELQHMGLDLLGVSTPDEGIALRRAGINLPIVVMICPQEEVEKVIQYHLDPVIYSMDLIEPLAHAAENHNVNINVHLKMDTGMGRLGVPPKKFPKLIEGVLDKPCLKIVGFMTHFSCADEPQKDDFTRKQIHHFQNGMDVIQRFGITNIDFHAAATSGTIRFPESHFNMVRIGLGLYGIYPSNTVSQEIELNLAVALVSRITEIRYLKKGHHIGYGATFTVPFDDYRAGVIPLGYYDGLPWSLSNKGKVLVNGQKAPIIGRISMDSTIIDLSQIPDAQTGSDVLIYGKHEGYTIRPENVAGQAGTIVYELLTRLGSRIQRIFLS